MEAGSFPSEDEIFQWVLDLYSVGRRVPGSEGDLKAERYLRDKLLEFGFEGVRMEPIKLFGRLKSGSWKSKQTGKPRRCHASTFHILLLAERRVWMAS